MVKYKIYCSEMEVGSFDDVYDPEIYCKKSKRVCSFFENKLGEESSHHEIGSLDVVGASRCPGNPKKSREDLEKRIEKQPQAEQQKEPAGNN